MADSMTASDSITASLVNGFDPPDVTSTKFSTENKDEGGDVSGTSKKDAEEKKSVEEVKGVVVEEKALEDLKDGVDEDMDEVKDAENGNDKSIEINDNRDEKDLGSTKDSGEKKDVGDINDMEDSGHVEEKEDASATKEANEKKGVGETMYQEGLSDSNDTKIGKEKKGAGEANEMEGKIDVEEISYLERQIDAKQAKEGDKKKDVVKALDEEEEKGFGETKNGEGKKIAEQTKYDEGKIIVEEGMNAEENNVAEVTEDIGCKNNVHASCNLKDNGEKNYISDVKGIDQKQVVEGEVHKDDNFVEQLKYAKKKQVVQGINDDEQKRYLGSENDVKKKSKLVAVDERVKAKRKPKDIGKVEDEVGKKMVVVDEKDEETVAIRGLEDEKEDVAEEVHISDKDDVAAEEDDDGDTKKKSSNKKLARSLKRRWDKGQRSANKGEVKDKGRIKGKKESGKKTKELMSTIIDTVSSPLGSSRERPVRERKTVERLVEVIEKEPNKAVIIEKGRGTPLKDIPNVAYTLTRKRPADLKFLHQILFGRRGKVVDFKSNILQFSGFAWHEAEEKHRAKIKEKLDKCVKDNLLELCDLLDLTVSKTNTKKEEIIVKLVDFLEAPHATTGNIIAEREQSEKSRKRKRFSEGSGSRSSGGTPAKRSRKKSAKAEGTHKPSEKNPQDTVEEDEEEDTENGVPDKDDAPRHSESDAMENELSEASDDEGENEDKNEFGKRKKGIEQDPKKQGSTNAEKRRTGSNSKKVFSETQVKSPVKSPSSSKHMKVKKNNTAEKVFTRKKKKGSESPESRDEEENEDVAELGKRNQDSKQFPKRQGSSISKKRKTMESNSKKASSQIVVKSPVKTPSSFKQVKAEKDDTGEKVFSRKKKDGDSTKKLNSKSSVKDNSSGKKSGKGKATGEERKSGPSKTDLRKTICEILKEVDFNTATFTDILKKLAAHYKMDLTPKKAAIKQMIQEELTKMADAAEDSEDEAEKDVTGIEENPKPAGMKVKA